MKHLNSHGRGDFPSLVQPTIMAELVHLHRIEHSGRVMCHVCRPIRRQHLKYVLHHLLSVLHQERLDAGHSRLEAQLDLSATVLGNVLFRGTIRSVYRRIVVYGIVDAVIGTIV